MTKNELIVESCRNMAFQDLRDTLSAAPDNRDATIAALRAEVERLTSELTQLREDRRVLGAEVNKWREVAGSGDEGHWVYSDAHTGKTTPIPEADATDKSGALGRVNPPLPSTP